MKVLVKIVLLLFITFLATPTVVGFLKSDTDTSSVYSFSEEETIKEIKETKAQLKFELQIPVYFVAKPALAAITFENTLKHDSSFREIFSPPPELV
ncbi:MULTISPECIES: hypothetical protein [Flavobacterium]|uniref:hypothetical protein n=1 Tax=Flavobacterium TaxID=237 RepID=UPI0009628E3C|nr:MULTISPECIES: hypothetical protein [Flavobacterium]MBN9285779.1 hypothetical protein [Flavobacterium sp.]OJV70339.1 MAG: hypothetical protein BGO42_10655 [Flavobacterium sp. 40-81]